VGVRAGDALRYSPLHASFETWQAVDMGSPRLVVLNVFAMTAIDARRLSCQFTAPIRFAQCSRHFE
jgi:hypothetical protein